MENPFSEGENRILRPPSTAIVIFGSTGDLTHRKLVPALCNLMQDDYLPSKYVVIGTGRTKLSDQEFRDSLRKSVKEFSRRDPGEELWKKFSSNVFYQQLDISQEADFGALKARLDGISKEYSEDFSYLYYLATAPAHFAQVASNLAKVGLVERPGSLRNTNLVVEKPFGIDLASARELNHKLRESFAENQILRIDHYLGKETVQNILVFRFANGIFEPLWNRNYIEQIQISVCEDIGVGSRAAYFDQAGIMRDIVQNHLLQMLALLCIEAPISLSDADSIRDEKVKVLRSIKRFSAQDVFSDTVRARYTRGFIGGKEVPAYLEEKGVIPESTTETFVAMKLEIENWRWAGVPIYIRAGKRMPKRITEITVYFKRPPESLFRGRQVHELEHNVLAIQVQPKEGISLKVSSKAPGPRMRVRPVEMDFNYGTSFGTPSADAYERLILDAMRSDATLFTRDDEIEEAWDLLTPVFEAWGRSESPTVHDYASGSWGPRAAAQLLKPQGHRWRRL